MSAVGACTCAIIVVLILTDMSRASSVFFFALAFNGEVLVLVPLVVAHGSVCFMSSYSLR